MRKVLGFFEIDALVDDGRALVDGYAIDKSKLVPVNLKSESVTVKWLEKWIEGHENFGDVDAIKLIKAARGQAKKEE